MIYKKILELIGPTVNKIHVRMENSFANRAHKSKYYNKA